MMPTLSRGALVLADLDGRTADLVVACNRCDRAGRYHLAKLIDRHGSAFPLPEPAAPAVRRLRETGVGQRAYDRCGAHFPELPGLFR